MIRWTLLLPLFQLRLLLLLSYNAAVEVVVVVHGERCIAFVQGGDASDLTP